jgi:hypothetical protein
MRDIFIVDIVTTLTRSFGPGGIRAVVAESLPVK